MGTAAAGKQALATTTTLYFPQPGMTLANAALQPLARLVRMEGGLLTLDREVPPEAWNAVADDGAPRAYVLEYGPGDRITIPTVTRYRRP